jgi:hypothetical protein
MLNLVQHPSGSHRNSESWILKQVQDDILVSKSFHSIEGWLDIY